jgi:protein phosphatase methylesterase 1
MMHNWSQIGDTTTNDDHDLSWQTLVLDTVDIIKSIYGTSKLPPLVVVGHSMGGAIAIHLAATKLVTQSCLVDTHLVPY